MIANGAAFITDWTVTHACDRRGQRGVDAQPGHERYATEAEPAGQHGLGRDDADEEPVRQGRHGHGTPPFQRNFNGTKGACDDIPIDFWDREEKKNSTPGGFSPPQPGVTAALCWEANVITFKQNGVLGSTNTNFLDVNAKGFINGWAQLTFIYTNAKLSGGQTVGVQLDVGFGPFSAPSATYAGLPVVGFAVQSYNNNVIVVGGKNVQSTYGADFAHKYNTDVRRRSVNVRQTLSSTQYMKGGTQVPPFFFFAPREMRGTILRFRCQMPWRRLSESSVRS